MAERRSGSLAPVLYLDDEWIAAAGRAVAGMTPTSVPLVVGYAISPPGSDPGSKPDSSTTSYSIQFGPDPVNLSRGTADADLIFTTTAQLAAEIARGERSAQRAFLDGELRVTGDVNLLLGHGDSLAAVDDVLADLRHSTVFP